MRKRLSTGLQQLFLRGWVAVACGLWLMVAYPAPAEARDTLAEAYQLGRKGQWKQAVALAKQSGGAAKKLVYWMYLRSAGTDASFKEISDFMEQYPTWPDHQILRRRAEEALDKESLPPATVIAWLEKHPPLTRDAMLKLAEAYIAQSGNRFHPKAVQIIRDIWRKGMLMRAEYREFQLKYGSYLRREDHVAHIDHLLWRGHFTNAKNLMHLVDKDYQLLFETRMLLAKGEGNVTAKLAAIPKQLKLDPGLLFERMRWRANKRDIEGVQEILLIAPKELPFPDAWWEVRRRLIRELASYHYYKHAYVLSRNHGQTHGINLADATWLNGWLSLVHMKKPQEAYESFYQLFHGVTYPVSKSRGAYWAGRAARANGNKDIANRWYGIAAKYGYTFYGQLAQLELNPNAKVQLPHQPDVNSAEYKAYIKEELPQTVMMLVRLNELSLVRNFIIHMAKYENSPMRRAMAAKLGDEIHRSYYGVVAAKEALKEEIFLLDSGYPVKNFTPKRPIEMALALAITRQESEFREDARSPAGALGMMQVLPSTAKETAKKLGMPFQLAALTQNPHYNMQIGSAYLAGLIAGFDNTMLAVASYNAGPGRIRQFIKRFGDPSNPSVTDPVLWVEEMPINETRNYVHRVLENYQVYRYKLAKDRANVPLLLRKDLGYR